MVSTPYSFQLPEPLDPYSIPAPDLPIYFKHQVYDNPHIFDKVDYNAIKVARKSYTTFRDLLWHLVFRYKMTDLERARVIFRWMTCCDMSTLNFETIPKDSPEEVLVSLKNSKVSYANVLELMCRFSGLYCLTVNGYVKGVDYRPGDIMSDKTFNHSWNIVYIQGSWQLIDALWATRYLSVRKNVQDSMVYQYDDFYFLMEPQQAIYSHFPQKSVWQLLPEPLTLHQFESLPLTKSQFFKCGLHFHKQLHGVVHSKDGNLKMTLGSWKANHFTYKLITDKNVDVFEGVPLKYFVTQETTNNLLNFYFRFPAPGNYYMTVFVQELNELNAHVMPENIFRAACEYKIIVDKPASNRSPYPMSCHNLNWGPNWSLLSHYNLVPVQEDGIISINSSDDKSSQKIEIQFGKTRDDVELLCKLRKNGVKDEDILDKYIDIFEHSDQTNFVLDLPEPGEYGLEIYANEPLDGDTFTQVCQYLLDFQPPPGYTPHYSIFEPLVPPSEPFNIRDMYDYENDAPPLGTLPSPYMTSQYSPKDASAQTIQVQTNNELNPFESNHANTSDEHDNDIFPFLLPPPPAAAASVNIEQEVLSTTPLATDECSFILPQPPSSTDLNNQLNDSFDPLHVETNLHTPQSLSILQENNNQQNTLNNLDQPNIPDELLNKYNAVSSSIIPGGNDQSSPQYKTHLEKDNLTQKPHNYNNIDQPNISDELLNKYNAVSTSIISGGIDQSSPQHQIQVEKDNPTQEPDNNNDNVNQPNILDELFTNSIAVSSSMIPGGNDQSSPYYKKEVKKVNLTQKPANIDNIIQSNISDELLNKYNPVSISHTLTENDQSSPQYQTQTEKDNPTQEPNTTTNNINQLNISDELLNKYNAVSTSTIPIENDQSSPQYKTHLEKDNLTQKPHNNIDQPNISDELINKYNAISTSIISGGIDQSSPQHQTQVEKNNPTIIAHNNDNINQPNISDEFLNKHETLTILGENEKSSQYQSKTEKDNLIQGTYNHVNMDEQNMSDELINKYNAVSTSMIPGSNDQFSLQYHTHVDNAPDNHDYTDNFDHPNISNDFLNTYNEPTTLPISKESDQFSPQYLMETNNNNNNMIQARYDHDNVNQPIIFDELLNKYNEVSTSMIPGGNDQSSPHYLAQVEKDHLIDVPNNNNELLNNYNAASTFPIPIESDHFSPQYLKEEKNDKLKRRLYDDDDIDHPNISNELLTNFTSMIPGGNDQSSPQYLAHFEKDPLIEAPNNNVNINQPNISDELLNNSITVSSSMIPGGDDQSHPQYKKAVENNDNINQSNTLLIPVRNDQLPLKDAAKYDRTPGQDCHHDIDNQNISDQYTTPLVNELGHGSYVDDNSDFPLPPPCDDLGFIPLNTPARVLKEGYAESYLTMCGNGPSHGTLGIDVPLPYPLTRPFEKSYVSDNNDDVYDAKEHLRDIKVGEEVMDNTVTHQPYMIPVGKGLSPALSRHVYGISGKNKDLTPSEPSAVPTSNDTKLPTDVTSDLNQSPLFYSFHSLEHPGSGEPIIVNDEMRPSDLGDCDHVNLIAAQNNDFIEKIVTTEYEIPSQISGQQSGNLTAQNYELQNEQSPLVMNSSGFLNVADSKKSVDEHSLELNSPYKEDNEFKPRNELLQGDQEVFEKLSPFNEDLTKSVCVNLDGSYADNSSLNTLFERNYQKEVESLIHSEDPNLQSSSEVRHPNEVEPRSPYKTAPGISGVLNVPTSLGGLRKPESLTYTYDQYNNQYEDSSKIMPSPIQRYRPDESTANWTSGPVQKEPPKNFQPTPLAVDQVIYKPEIEALPKEESVSMTLSVEKSATIFQRVDDHAMQISSQHQDSFNQLIWQLIYARNITDELEKVRVIFLWLCTKDLHKMDFNHTKKESPEEILMGLKTGKSTYAQIFLTLCKFAGLHCKLIVGYAKGVDYVPGMQFQGRHGEHSWNAVLITGVWRLVDCHWAARRLIGRERKPENVRYELDMFYFLANPSQLIYTHFPHEQDWQLLHHPINIEEFESLTPVKSMFFKYNLDLTTHKNAVIYSTSPEFELRISFPKGVQERLIFTFTLTFNDGTEDYKGLSLLQYGRQEIDYINNHSSFWIRGPTPGSYKLLLYAKLISVDQAGMDSSSQNMFGAICEYKIEFDFPARLVLSPFPPCNTPTYGPSEVYIRYAIESCVAQSSILTENGSTEFKFLVHGANTRVMCKLITGSSKSSDEITERCVLQRLVGPEEVIISVFLPEAGEYGLEIYANDSLRDGNSFYTIWQYFIVTKCASSINGLPSIPPGYLGAYEPRFTNYGLRTFSHKDPFIIVTVGEELCIQLKTSRDQLVRIMTQMIHCTHNVSEMCSNQVLQQAKDSTIYFLVRFPHKGFFKLQIFALPYYEMSESLPGVFNYIIENKHSPIQIVLDFPQQFAHWKEGCYLYEPTDGVLGVHQKLEKITFRMDVPRARNVAVVVDNVWTRLRKEYDGCWTGEVMMKGIWGHKRVDQLTVCANYGDGVDDDASFTTILKYSVH